MSKAGLVLAALLVGAPAAGWAAPKASEREPVKFRVVAVNPSDLEIQRTAVKQYLPQEVTPRDVLELDGLELDYDEAKTCYFVYKERVELQPRQTKVFDVVVRDLWIVPDTELDQLRRYAGVLLGKLQSGPYAETSRPIGESVLRRLDEIEATQASEATSRRQRIGMHRIHRATIVQLKEELARLEKLLTFSGGPPVPQMLQESKLKLDAPSTKTTWLLIFLIAGFTGLMGAAFFLTWHRRAQASQELAEIRQVTFPTPDRGDPGKVA